MHRSPRGRDVLRTRAIRALCVSLCVVCLCLRLFLLASAGAGTLARAQARWLCGRALLALLRMRLPVEHGHELLH